MELSDYQDCEGREKNNDFRLKTRLQVLFSTEILMDKIELVVAQN